LQRRLKRGLVGSIQTLRIDLRPHRGYGSVTAVVDAKAGNDSTGVAHLLKTNAPPAAFKTINGATIALRDTNNALFARPDAGAGVIYLKEGGHSWTGGTAAPETFLPPG